MRDWAVFNNKTKTLTEVEDYEKAVSVCDSTLQWMHSIEEPQATVYVFKVAEKWDVEEGNNRIIVNQGFVIDNQEKLISLLVNVRDLSARLLATTEEEEINSIKSDLIEAIKRANEFEDDIEEG